MTPRSRPCDPGVTTGRLAKARQFREAALVVSELADDEADVADATVTLLVHAGIAAADAICCAALGRHATGESHQDAVAHLASVRPDGRELAKALSALLGVKTRAGYSSERVSADQRRRAMRSADRLLQAAQVRVVRE